MKTEITLKGYILALFVLFLFGMSVIAIAVSIPYLVFLVLKLIFTSLDFGLVFVILFWLFTVLFLWSVKILSIVSGRPHT